MSKIVNWFRSLDRDKVTRNSFLIPILLVVAISISHVTTWYDLGNPMAWAIYLSIAIEIFALASVSAASIKMNRFSIWFLFCLVTSIQIIGNVFFTFNDIDVSGAKYKSWVELIQPVFAEWDVIDHKRLLALVQGGLLPLMSLTALHYYIKFGDKDAEKKEVEYKTTGSDPKPVDNPEIVDMKVSYEYKPVDKDNTEKKKEDGVVSEWVPQKEIHIPEDAPLMEEPEHEEREMQPNPQHGSTDKIAPPSIMLDSDGRIQETFNFQDQYFKDPVTTPAETMTSKINNT